MKLLSQITLLLVSAGTFAQIKGIVTNSTTKEPVPYTNIWTENEDKGTTADENGFFTLPAETDTSKRLLFNSVGYAPLYVRISELKDTVYLVSQPIELKGIIIANPTGKNKQVVNPLKKIKKTETFHSGSQARMLARLIPYKPEYATTPYINKIRFPVQKYKKPFTFNLRLYSVAEDQSPGEPIYDENILITIPPDKKEISIDFSKLNIKMPEEGLYIVIERFLIKENISGTVYKELVDKNNKLLPVEKREYLYDLFGPVFTCEQTATAKGGWNYYKGKWNAGYHVQIVAPPEKAHIHGLIAVEITLTD